MYYLGIDLGSYSLESVLVDEKGTLVWRDQALTAGDSLRALQQMAERC